MEPLRACRQTVIAKLLLTVAVIALVWLGFRYVGRWLGGAGAAPGTGRVGNAAPGGAIDDLTRCAVCETYVEAGATPRASAPTARWPAPPTRPERGADAGALTGPGALHRLPPARETRDLPGGRPAQSFQI